MKHLERLGASAHRRLLSLLLVVVVLGLGAPGCGVREPGSAGSGGAAAATMPATLRMAALRTLQRAAGHDFIPDATGILRTRAGSQGAAAEVVGTGRGVRLFRRDDGGLALGVETTSVGREGARGSRGVGSQRAEGQELVLDRDDDVEERFLAGPLGLEQSYVVRAPPEGRGPLMIEVAFDGLAPEAVDGATDRVSLRDESGHVRAGYRDLIAADAEGRELAARMEVRPGGVALVVEDAGARYPVRVDPIVWTQQAELTASDGGYQDGFGWSVSVSGGTAVVGAPNHPYVASGQQGAAYVFVQSGSTWIQQAELIAGDRATSDGFGASVSVSGGTAIVGAPYHQVGTNVEQGAAYVFVQSGTTWTQQAELTASNGGYEDQFGYSVSVSGGIAVVGLSPYGAEPSIGGAAYVFVQSGTTWTQQAALTASDGGAGDGFGGSVSVSGGTIIIGAPNHQVGTNARQGAAYVFVQSGTTWTRQAELYAGDGAAGDSFGYSVSVSGGTVIVGAPLADSNQGSAYIFVQSGTAWTQQAELAEGDSAANAQFGMAVSVSGGTVIVGAPSHPVGTNLNQGAAYVFAQSGTTWTQQAEVLASDGLADDAFGNAVSVGGGVVIIGARAHPFGTATSNEGAAYVMVPETLGTPCTSDADCQIAHCVDGVCCDTACGGGVATDCQSCLGAMTGGADGICGPVSASAAYICRPSAAACDAAGTCGGTSTACPPDAPMPDGTACNDGNACTQTDTCQAGVCTGKSPVTCTASDACHLAGTCDPTSGQCSNPSAPDGTACNDGNACTQTDACIAGVCTGKNPVTCTASDACHLAGTCDPTSGTCSNPTAPDGAACNDGNACTQTDACTAGVCTGTNPVTCTANDACHLAGTCDPTSGQCSNPSAPDGTACNDGNACTQTDACTAGVCTGTNPVTCTASDACHLAGTCDPTSGQCSNPSAPDGTACNDGDACTQTDACAAGVCTGKNPVTCTASDACHLAGTCDPTSGQCSNPNAPEGTPCSLGACASGVCTPAPDAGSGTGGAGTTSNADAGGTSTVDAGTGGTGTGGSTSSSSSGTGGSTSSSSSGTGGSASSSSSGTGGSASASSGTGGSASASSGTGGSGSASSSSSGTGGSAGSSSSGTGGSGSASSSNGCSCREAGAPAPENGLRIAALVVLGLGLRRRRAMSAAPQGGRS